MRLRHFTAALTLGAIGCLATSAPAEPATAQPATRAADLRFEVRRLPPAAAVLPTDAPPPGRIVIWTDAGPRPVFLQTARSDAHPEKGAYLGISTSPTTPVLRHQTGLPKGVGLVAEFVAPGSPAEQAGVKQYDVLHKVNDQLLVNQQQLAVLVRTFKPGDEVKLTVLRDGKPQTLTAKLEEKELPPLDELRFGEVDRVERFLPRPQGPYDLQVRPPARLVPPPTGIPFRPLPAGTGEAPGELLADSITLTWDDGDFTLTITTEDGKRRLLARDKAGKTLFDGPIDTEEQRGKIPDEVRKRMDRIGPVLTPPPTTRPATDAPNEQGKGGA